LYRIFALKRACTRCQLLVKAHMWLFMYNAHSSAHKKWGARARSTGKCWNPLPFTEPVQLKGHVQEWQEGASSPPCGHWGGWLGAPPCHTERPSAPCGSQRLLEQQLHVSRSLKSALCIFRRIQHAKRLVLHCHGNSEQPGTNSSSQSIDGSTAFNLCTALRGKHLGRRLYEKQGRYCDA